MLDNTDPRRVTQRGLQAVLRETRHLNKLPPQQLLRLTLAGTVRQLPEQSHLTSEGLPLEELYVVLRGAVAVGLYEDLAPALWLYISGPGTVVDACALLEPPVSPVTIRALTDIEVLAIPRKVFLQVMQEAPAVGYEILQDLSCRLALIARATLKEFSQGYQGPSRN